MSRVYMQKTRMRNCLKCLYNFGFLQIMYVKTILINIKLSCLWRCHHVRRSGIRVASLFLMLARFQEPLTKTKHHSLFPFCSFVPRGGGRGLQGGACECFQTPLLSYSLFKCSHIHELRTKRQVG